MIPVIVLASRYGPSECLHTLQHLALLAVGPGGGLMPVIVLAARWGPLRCAYTPMAGASGCGAGWKVDASDSVGIQVGAV